MGVKTLGSGGGRFEVFRMVLKRVRAEFDEMPGLCLTTPQAQRLFGIDETTCEVLLRILVEGGFLRVGRFGYVRA
jgi:hypothetical protein